MRLGFCRSHDLDWVASLPDQEQSRAQTEMWEHICPHQPLLYASHMIYSAFKKMNINKIRIPNDAMSAHVRLACFDLPDPKNGGRARSWSAAEGTCGVWFEHQQPASSNHCLCVFLHILPTIEHVSQEKSISAILKELTGLADTLLSWQ